MAARKYARAKTGLTGAITVALLSAAPVMAQPAAELSGSREDVAEMLDSSLSIERRAPAPDAGGPAFILRNRGPVAVRLESVSPRVKFANGHALITLNAGDMTRLTLVDRSIEDSVVVPVRVLNARFSGERPMAYVVQCGPWSGVEPC